MRLSFILVLRLLRRRLAPPVVEGVSVVCVATDAELIVSDVEEVVDSDVEFESDAEEPPAPDDENAFRNCDENHHE